MHGAMPAMRSHCSELLEDGSDGTPLLEIVETTNQDRLPLKRIAPSRGRRPKPAWWLLYAVVPLTVLLFMLADLLSPTSGWRSASELLAALVLLWAIGLWLRANRLALILADYCDQSESPREMPRGGWSLRSLRSPKNRQTAHSG
jgi:hypothetical protein